MFIRRVLAAAVGAALVLTPLTALGSNAQPGLVKQNAADYTPQLVPTAAVPRPSVDGIAAGPITTYAGGHFDRVTGTSGAVTNIVAFDTATGAIKTAFGPTLDNVVRDVAYAPDTGGVYVGGDFTTVNGASASTLVKLNPNGTVAWKAPWTRGIVQDVDLVSVGGAPHLIVAGSFPQKLVSLNPSTGKDDGLIDQSITGEACLPDGTCSWGNTSVYDVAVANGHLVAVGNFAAPRAKFFMLDYNGTAFALSNWYYNSFAKPCSTTATRRIANLQGVDWNPNGQYFDVAATGQIPKNKSEIWHAKPSPDDPTQSDSTVCDAVGRFALTDPRKPVWINYTGGDSVWEVADTGAAVYIQGHFKWVDNADGYASNGIGDTSDGSPAARRAGIAALDPVAGRACSPTAVLATCSWSPAVPTKTGGRALEVTSQGLWAGTDSAKFAAEDHYGIAFAPL
jgi:hypothetical protein